MKPNIYLDGTTQETFNESMDNLLDYLLSLSSQKTDGQPVRCLNCGATQIYRDNESYKCGKCEHDTGEIKTI